MISTFRKLKITENYTQVSNQSLAKTKSPLDHIFDDKQ